MRALLITASVAAAIAAVAYTTLTPDGSVAANAGPAARSVSASPAAPLALAASGPVVAELFTSQGCSSCPPADAVAARLARDPAVLVISRPVTYWDRLGWKDSLGREQNTQLQRQYGDTAFAGANIYTPQLVVDGSAQAVGSQETAVRGLLGRAASARANSDVTARLSRTADGGGRVMLEGSAGAGAELVLVALSANETVRIGRGENGGRTLHYTNVVVGETPLGRWSGGEHVVALSPAQFATPGADRHALIVRRGPGGPIIGSAVI